MRETLFASATCSCGQKMTTNKQHVIIIFLHNLGYNITGAASGLGWSKTQSARHVDDHLVVTFVRRAGQKVKVHKEIHGEGQEVRGEMPETGSFISTERPLLAGYPPSPSSYTKRIPSSMMQLHFTEG